MERDLINHLAVIVKDWINGISFPTDIPVMAISYCMDELLKQPEPVKPYVDIDEYKCPTCNVKLTRQELLGDNVLFEDFFDFCPKCGKPVKWD